MDEIINKHENNEENDIEKDVKKILNIDINIFQIILIIITISFLYSSYKFTIIRCKNYIFIYIILLIFFILIMTKDLKNNL